MSNSKLARISFARMLERPAGSPRSDTNHFCCLCGGDCVVNSLCSDRYTMAQGDFADSVAPEVIFFCDLCDDSFFDSEFDSVYFSGRGLFRIEIVARMNDC
jgi:hypothetical protein